MQSWVATKFSTARINTFFLIFFMAYCKFKVKTNPLKITSKGDIRRKSNHIIIIKRR